MARYDLRGIPDDLWAKVEEKARSENRSKKEVIVELLQKALELDLTNTVRLNPKFIKKIRELADRYGLTFGEMIHLLIIEGLANEDKLESIIVWYRLGKEVGHSTRLPR